MYEDFRWPWLVAAAATTLGWLTLSVVIGRRRLQESDEPRSRDRSADVGTGLQFVALALVLLLWRPAFTPFLPGAAGLVAAVSAAALALGSGALLALAVRTLGRHWSLQARLRPDHELVTDGPYRWVRHPIYSGFLGLFLATGLALTTWRVLALACVPFLAGTWLRVRAEDRLLRSAFGARHDAWRARVKALVPGLV